MERWFLHIAYPVTLLQALLFQGVERSLEFEVFASGHTLAPSVQSSCLLALPSKVGLSRPSKHDRQSKSRCCVGYVGHILNHIRPYSKNCIKLHFVAENLYHAYTKSIGSFPHVNNALLNQYNCHVEMSLVRQAPGQRTSESEDFMVFSIPFRWRCDCGKTIDHRWVQGLKECQTSKY